MSDITLTIRGWLVVSLAALTMVVGITVALHDKCWNHQGIGYTACAYTLEGK